MVTKEYSKITSGSDRNFGFVFAVLFLVIGLWPAASQLWYGVWPPEGDVVLTRWWALAVSGGIVVVGLLAPVVLHPLNWIWFKLGMILGAVVAPVVMALFFFIVITPISLIMRVFRKDVLDVRIDKNKDSYWIKRREEIGPMENQF